MYRGQTLPASVLGSPNYLIPNPCNHMYEGAKPEMQNFASGILRTYYRNSCFFLTNLEFIILSSFCAHLKIHIVCEMQGEHPCSQADILWITREKAEVFIHRNRRFTVSSANKS